MILLTILPWLGGMLSGIFLIGTRQFTRATVDTADHTGEMLAILKQQQEEEE